MCCNIHLSIDIITDEYGTRRPLYYFLTSTYWTGKKGPSSQRSNDSNQKVATTEYDLSQMDEDVRQEEDAILHDRLPPNTAVIIKNLTKTYQPRNTSAFSLLTEWFGSWFGRKRNNNNGNSNNNSKNGGHTAVKDLCLSIEEDTLLCLLGTYLPSFQTIYQSIQF